MEAEENTDNRSHSRADNGKRTRAEPLRAETCYQEINPERCHSQHSQHADRFPPDMYKAIGPRQTPESEKDCRRTRKERHNNADNPENHQDHAENREQNCHFPSVPITRGMRCAIL